MRCGLPVAATVNNATQGRGGCRVCHTVESDSAFDFFGPGVLYLIASDTHRAYKLGITGEGTNRLAMHRTSEFDNLLHTHEALGYEVNYVEQYVLNWLREVLRVPPAVSPDALPGGGSTETWAYDTVAPEEVWAFAMRLFEERGWPIPRAMLLGTASKKPRQGCRVIEGGEPCSRRNYSLGYCQLHYSRFKKYGDPLHLEREPWTNTTCQVIEDGQECGKPAARKGMCQTHYWRDWANGSPTLLKRPAPQPRRGECGVEGCAAPDTQKGLCLRHYSREYKKKRRGVPSLLD